MRRYEPPYNKANPFYGEQRALDAPNTAVDSTRIIEYLALTGAFDIPLLLEEAMMPSHLKNSYQSQLTALKRVLVHLEAPFVNLDLPSE